MQLKSGNILSLAAFASTFLLLPTLILAMPFPTPGAIAIPNVVGGNDGTIERRSPLLGAVAIRNPSGGDTGTNDERSLTGRTAGSGENDISEGAKKGMILELEGLA